MVETKVQRDEEIRDLSTQIDELRRQDEGEIIFRENSPKRRKVVLYRRSDGERVEIPEYMAPAALRKREGGDYMFTSHKDQAPEYRLGNILCFLHKDSPDQLFLKEIGLAGEANHCRKATISNEYSKRIHGMHRHHDEWEAYQSFLDDQKEDRANARADHQLEATLALAGRAAGTEAPVAVAEAPSAASEPLRAAEPPTTEDVWANCSFVGCEFTVAPGPAEGVEKALDLHRRTEHA